VNYEPGLLVAERYRLEEIIATGGMGQVWRAVDETLERPVAVKVLRPDTASEEGFLERFRAEAKHSAALQHPNIATVHDFGEGAHSAYLVMELIDGKPLSEIIKERAPLPAEEVTDILYQAALALNAAHQAGVVHRDVKPANIVVDDEGYARLTDFGISRAIAGAQLTQTGEVLGTPHYLAPEQAQGQPAGPASDLYALAVVGYELITGNRPFAGDSMITTALAHVSQPAPQLPADVPDPLRTTVMAGLAKDPARRPASGEAMAEALHLPVGTVPEDLVEGAESAVAPVVSGAGLLTPDPSVPTGAMTLSPQTPPAPASVLAPPRAGAMRRWLVPGAAVLAAVVAIVVMAISSSGQEGALTPFVQPRATVAADQDVPATPSSTTSTTSTTPAAVTGAGGGIDGGNRQ
jgi:serine/threonine-protein kinase